MSNNLDWYILYTRPGQARKVEQFLKRKSVDCYLPQPRKQFANERDLELMNSPLFTSYLFVKAASHQLPEFRKAPGVINFMYHLNQPAVVPAHEISLLRDVLQSFREVLAVPNSSLQKYNFYASEKGLTTFSLSYLGFTLVANAASESVRVITSSKKSMVFKGTASRSWLAWR